jgi:hypothetical protein
MQLKIYQESAIRMTEGVYISSIIKFLFIYILRIIIFEDYL